MILRVIAPPTWEPVAFEEVWDHLRLSDDYDAQGVLDALKAAREQAEHKLGLSLSTRTLEVMTDPLPPDRFTPPGVWQPDGSVLLPFGPVQAVTQIAYTPYGATVETTLLPADFPLAGDRVFAVSWPSTYALGKSLRIRYTAGYEAKTDVPRPIRQWIKLQAAALLENRERVAPGPGVADLSGWADELLSPFVSRVA